MGKKLGKVGGERGFGISCFIERYWLQCDITELGSIMWCLDGKGSV